MRLSNQLILNVRCFYISLCICGFSGIDFVLIYGFMYKKCWMIVVVRCSCARVFECSVYISGTGGLLSLVCTQLIPVGAATHQRCNLNVVSLLAMKCLPSSSIALTRFLCNHQSSHSPYVIYLCNLGFCALLQICFSCDVCSSKREGKREGEGKLYEQRKS